MEFTEKIGSLEILLAFNGTVGIIKLCGKICVLTVVVTGHLKESSDFLRVKLSALNFHHILINSVLCKEQN